MVAHCTEIMHGNVMFLENNLLCYENTINWKDILTGENSEVIHHRGSKDMTRECKRHSRIVQYRVCCPVVEITVVYFRRAEIIILATTS